MAMMRLLLFFFVVVQWGGMETLKGGRCPLARRAVLAGRGLGWVDKTYKSIKKTNRSTSRGDESRWRPWLLK